MTRPERDRRGLVGLLGAAGVSALGTRMSFLALPWFVLSTSGSPTSAGLVAAAELTPYVLVQALGGPLVDRWGAWRASVVTDVGAAVTVGAVPALHAVGSLDLWTLTVLMGLAGALRGAGDAARQVLLPGVGELAQAGIERSAGLFDGIGRGASLIGAPVAGVLIGLTSAVNVLALDAVTFAVSSVLVLAVVPPSAQPGGEHLPTSRDEPAGGGYVSALAEGFRYLRRDRLLVGIAVMVLVTNMIDQAGGTVLFPLWAKDVAHSSVALGVMGGCFGVGAVLGNAVTTWLGPRLRRRPTYAIGFLLAGCPRYFLLAVAGTVSPVLFVSVLSGLAAGGLNPVLGAVEFERVPRHLQARVLGALGATAWAGIPLGSLAGGTLAQAIGLRTTLLIAGALYLTTTLAPFVFPVWAEMDQRRPEPAGKLSQPSRNTA